MEIPQYFTKIVLDILDFTRIDHDDFPGNFPIFIEATSGALERRGRLVPF
jgi:hypothetical protein